MASMRQISLSTPKQIIEHTLVWDNHICIGSRLDSPWIDDLQRAHHSGFSFVSVNVGDANLDLDTVIRLIANVREWIAEHTEQFALASTVADVCTAHRAGKTAVAFDVEGVFSLQGQINLVPLLYELGVRWMLIAYNRSNWAGGGCHDGDDQGLTKAGFELVKEMDRVGMVKCCSHTGERSALDVLASTDRPVICSHSNARSVHDHPRNISDAVARACAATGGVIGVNGLSIFLGSGTDLPQLLLQHIDHFVQLVGPEHVGLGLDYVLDLDDLNSALSSAEHTWPTGHGYDSSIQFIQPEQLPAIVAGMQGMGYALEHIQSILGGNFLRIAREVWQA